VALGNVGTEEDLPVLRDLAGDSDTLIAEHAAWAIAQIESRLQLRCAGPLRRSQATGAPTE
jgi:HEAT repeat protein